MSTQLEKSIFELEKSLKQSEIKRTSMKDSIVKYITALEIKIKEEKRASLNEQAFRLG